MRKLTLLLAVLLLLIAGIVPVFAQDDTDDNFAVQITWSPDSSQIATSYVDGRVEIYDINSREAITSFTAFEGSFLVLQLSWHPALPWIALGGTNGRLEIWDVSVPQRVDNTLVPSSGDISALSWNPDGNFLLISDRGGDIESFYVWDQLVDNPVYSANIATANAISWNNEAQFAIFTDGAGIQIYDAESYELISNIGFSFLEMNNLLQAYLLTAGDWNTTDNKIVAATIERRVEVWQVDTGELIFHADGIASKEQGLHPNIIRAAWFSPDGSTVRAVGGDGTYRTWDAQNGHLINDEQLPLVADFLRDAALSPDRTRIAYIEDGKTGPQIVDVHAKGR